MCWGSAASASCLPRDLRIVQDVERDPDSGMVARIALEIQLPRGFPEKYREAVIQSAQLCAVKKHIEKPPVFEILTSVN